MKNIRGMTACMGPVCDQERHERRLEAEQNSPRNAELKQRKSGMRKNDILNDDRNLC